MVEAVDNAWEIFPLLRDAELLAGRLESISVERRDEFLRCFNEAGWDPAKMKQAIIIGADIPQEYGPVTDLSFDPHYDEAGHGRL